MSIRSLVLALALTWMSVGCKGEPLPGEAAFELASDEIRSESMTHHAFGNTPQAEERAGKVRDILTELDRKLFTGHDKHKSMTFTDVFMVYCQHSVEGVAFLIHVPQFKRYQDEVRDTLLDAAWAAASVATEDLQRKAPLRIGVGLRGMVNYGAVMIGPAGGEKTFEIGESVSTEPLYPFFAAPAPEVKQAPAPVKEEPPPPPPPPPPATMKARTDYVSHLAASLVDAEILAHDADLQGCAKHLPEGSQFDYVVEIKADGKVKSVKPRAANREPPVLFTGCLTAAAKTWVFPNKQLKLLKPDTATIRFGNVSGPLE